MRMGGVPGLRGCGLAPGSYLPKTPSRGIRFTLKARLVLLLIAASFIALGAGLTSALNARAQEVPATPANEVSGHGEAGQGGLPAAAHGEEEHGLSQKAVEIGRVFGFPLTNSMVVSWAVALGLIVFVQAATRNMKRVPEGPQNFLEWLVESLYDFLEGIIGRHLVDRTFCSFATIFIFILSANWFGLIPGVGTIGVGAAKRSWIHDRPALVARRERRCQPGRLQWRWFSSPAGFFPPVRAPGPVRIRQGTLRAQGRHHRSVEVLLAVVFFAAGFASN